MEINLSTKSIGKKIFRYSNRVFMKIVLVSFVIFFLIGNLNSYAQADYSQPKEVAQAFLDFCLAGKRFEACKLYGAEGCNDEIEILIKQLVNKDIPLINKTCKYTVDSCKIDPSGKSAKCFFRKLCTDVSMYNEGFLTLKKIENKWLVEYLYKRDKYL